MWPFLLNPAQLGMPFVSDALHWLTLASLQGAFVLALAFGATRFKKQTSAAQRHFVWVLAFSALLVLPVFNLTLPNRVVVTPAPTISQQDTKQLSASNSAPDLSNASFASPTNSSSDPNPTPTIVTPLMASFSWQDAKQLILSSSSLIIVSVWFLGIAIMALRLMVGLVKLRQLERNSQPLETASWNEQVSAVRRQLGLLAKIRLRSSNSITGTRVPLTWGWRRPVILLPAEAAEWSSEKQRAVLLHEAAHIGRRDWAVLWFVQLARVVYWFHPFVWYAARELRAESEAATDDLVLATGFKASNYVEFLIEFMNLLGAGRYKSPTLSIGMVRTSMLGQRLTAVLDAKRNRRHLTRAQWLSGGVVATIGFLILSSLSVADEIVISQPAAERMVTVKGHILNTEGKPVAGASIVVYHGFGEGPALQKLQSDANGAYAVRVPDSAEKYRTLQIEKAGFGVKLANLTAQDAKAPKNWTLVAPTSLSGRVTDENNVPISNARVAVSYFIENHYYVGQVVGLETRTDAAGRYTLSRLPVGVESRFSIVAPRYASSEFDVKMEKNAAPYPTVKLQPGFEASGRVVDVNGKPLAGATVRRYDNAYPKAQCDAQGNFVLAGLTAREQKIEVDTDIPGQFPPANILVSPAKPNVRIQFVAGVKVRGRLVDADTLAPISGVKVENQYGSDGVRSPVASDAQGRYEILLPPINNFSLTFRKSTYQYRYIFLNEEQATRRDAGDTTLKRGTVWRGKVRINGKAPNDRVVLGLKSASANAQLWTDLEGNFQVNALPSGKYQWADDYGWKPVSPQEINIPTPQDAPFILDVDAVPTQRQSARGRVVDQNGRPLAYAQVKVKSGQRTFSAVTASDGRWQNNQLPVVSEAKLQSVEYRDISRESLGVEGQLVGNIWRFPDFKLNTRPEQAQVKVIDADGRAARGSRVLALWDKTSVFATTNAQGIATFRLAPQKVRFLAAKNLNYGEASFNATPKQTTIRLMAPRNGIREAEATVDRLIGSTVNSEIYDPAEVIGDERWRLATLRADGALKAGSTTPDWNRAGANFGLYLDSMVSLHPEVALQRAPIWLRRIQRPETTRPFFLRLAEANFARLASRSENANAKAWANTWLNRQLQVFNSPIILQSAWSGGDSVSRYLQGYNVAHNLGRSEAKRFIEAALRELPDQEENSHSYSYGAYFTFDDPNAVRFRSRLSPDDQVNFQGNLGEYAIRNHPELAEQAKAELESLLKEPALAQVKESTKRFARQITASAALKAEIRSLRQRTSTSTPRVAFAKLKTFDYKNGYNLSGLALSLIRRALERGDEKLAQEIYDFTIAQKWEQSDEHGWVEITERLARRPSATQMQQWRVAAISNLKNGDVSTGPNYQTPDLTIDAKRLRSFDPALGRIILEAKWSGLGPLGANPNMDNRYDAISIAQVMGRYDSARAFELFKRIPRGGNFDPKGDELTFAMRVIEAALRRKAISPRLQTPTELWSNQKR